jgi:hypothetical protein
VAAFGCQTTSPMRRTKITPKAMKNGNAAYMLFARCRHASFSMEHGTIVGAPFRNGCELVHTYALELRC